jgi:hypothetical protein
MVVAASVAVLEESAGGQLVVVKEPFIFDHPAVKAFTRNGRPPPEWQKWTRNNGAVLEGRRGGGTKRGGKAGGVLAGGNACADCARCLPAMQLGREMRSSRLSHISQENISGLWA